MTAQNPSPSQPPRGAVYSLGYARYAGTRRGPSSVPWVIARYAWRLQLRQRGVKAVLVFALVVLAIVGAYEGFSWAIPALAHGALATSARQGDTSVVTAALDAQFVPSFLLFLWCGAGAIAADLGAGAFQFHFARPVGTSGYIAGRLLGATGLPMLITLVTLAVLTLERAAFGATPLRALELAAEGTMLVTLRCAVFGAAALGLSSLTRRPGLAQGMFAALVLTAGAGTRIAARVNEQPWIRTLSPGGCIDALLHQVRGDAGLHGGAALAPALACAAWIAGGLGLAWRTVSRAEVQRG